MAPLKTIDSNIMGATKLATFKPQVGTKMTTRHSGRTLAAYKLKKMSINELPKRKADQLSPPKGKTTKRSAFYDITNAATAAANNACNIVQRKTSVVKKATVKVVEVAEPKLPTMIKVTKPAMKPIAGNKENADPLSIANPANAAVRKIKAVETKVEVTVKKDIKTRETRLKVKQESDVKEKQVLIEVKKEIKTEEVSASKSVDEDSSLYASALDTISTSADESLLIITPIKKQKPKVRSPVPPSGVSDFDKENWDDPCQVSAYAMDVFKYLKSREEDFVVGDYMAKQTLINNWMRSLLVDWMVDVQEHFELNHETLYLAVKVLDLYLNKKVVQKETLQLIGAASLFIASKYDERIPPAIDEFLHICENIYTREELIDMEIELFKQVDYCLGMPLSYRFLRRFARCCKTSMPILTLARYVLELSLMEYSMIFESESKLAAAALYLALRMKNSGDWSPTLEYYSGYKLADFLPIAVQLNAMLHRKPKEQLRTVRNKYSHTIFFEVAKTPLIASEIL